MKSPRLPPFTITTLPLDPSTPDVSVQGEWDTPEDRTRCRAYLLAVIVPKCKGVMLTGYFLGKMHEEGEHLLKAAAEQNRLTYYMGAWGFQ